jgi:hypothetical protein
MKDSANTNAQRLANSAHEDHARQPLDRMLCQAECAIGTSKTRAFWGRTRIIMPDAIQSMAALRQVNEPWNRSQSHRTSVTMKTEGACDMSPR